MTNDATVTAATEDHGVNVDLVPRPDAEASNGHEAAEASPGGPDQVFILRSLDLWVMWACTSIIAIFTLLPFGSAALLATDGWVATGDVAIIGIRSYDAWTADAPLVGQPTTGEEAVGIESSHPGPIENWIVGPFVRTLGAQLGLLVGVAAINGAALGLTLWMAFRRGGPALLSLTAVFLALLVNALGAPSLTDAFNSELPTYPTLAAVFAAWSLVQRDLVAAPILVVTASVAAQPHVVGGSSMVLPALIATGAVVVQIWRRQHTRRQALGPLLLAVSLGLLCWAPTMAQEVSSGPSNIAALARTSRASVAPLGIAHTAERVVTALAPVPIFARSGGSTELFAPRSVLSALLAALVLGGAGSLALFLRKWGTRGPVSLWLLATTSMLGAAALASNSPVVRALRIDTNRWLWTSGFLIWLSLIWSIWWSAPTSQRSRSERLAPALGIAAVLTLAGSVLIDSSDTSHMRDARYLAPTEALNRAVMGQVPHGVYRFEMRGPTSNIVVGPGLAYALVTDGYQLSVGNGVFGRRFGHDRQKTPDRLDGTIVLVDLSPNDPPPEGTLIARVIIPAEFERQDGVSIVVVLR